MIVVCHAGGYALRQFSEAETERAAILLNFLGPIIEHLNFGVYLFLVISGYCIYASVEASCRKPPKIFIAKLPTHLSAVFGGYVPFGWLGHASRISFSVVLPNSKRSYFASVGWEHNAHETWRQHLFGPESSLVMVISWSLCYEIQFDLVTGLMAASGEGFMPLRF